LRNAHELKIRQPLKSLHVVTRDKEEKAVLVEMAGLLAEELNVKDVVFRENEEDLVEYSAKANFKVLGKKLGKDMKAAASRIASLTPEEIGTLMRGAVLSVDFDGTEGTVLELTSESVDIRRSEKSGLKVLNEGALTVALDPEVTPELLSEGLVRDLVRGIQNLRKETGLDVTDRISVEMDGGDEVRAAADAHLEYLAGETLAESVEWTDLGGSTAAAPVSVGDFEVLVAVRKS
jgi:isoleucyl-tRNA synthetase